MAELHPLAAETQTATLQSHRMTVKRAAVLAHVSVRTMFKTRELIRTGREDLLDAVGRGEMAIHTALKIARPDKYRRRSRIEQLCTAWHLVSSEERAIFLVRVLDGLDDATRRALIPARKAKRCG